MKTKEEKISRKIGRNKGFSREILKIGVAGDSEKGDFIGLFRFGCKNKGKN